MSGWRILLWVALVFAGFGFLWVVRGVLTPFVLSFIIAGLLDPTVRKLRIRGLSLRASVAVVMVVFVGTVSLAAILVAPSISREASNLGDKAQEVTAFLARDNANDNFFMRGNPLIQATQTTTSSQIDTILAANATTLERFGLPTSRRAFTEQYIDKNRPRIAAAATQFSNSLVGIATGLFSGLMNVIFIPIMLPLILMEMEEFRRRGPRWIPPAFRASAVAILGDISQVFVRYMRGITTVVIYYALSMAALMWLTGVPSWILLAPIFGILYLIPFFGNIISAITVFAVVGFSGVTGHFFHPFPSPWAYAELVTGLYLLVGFAYDHFIYPQMVGNSVGLSPIVSMFVIFCGGALFGLPGMLISFPLAGSVKVVLDRLIRFTSASGDVLRLPSVPLRHRSP